MSYLYHNGLLSEVGKMKENKKNGEWLKFNDSLKLDYVFKYKKNSTDTIFRPFELINYSW
jgi:antitoxin component YwqK of YwqJK toxin-antitoxin module